ncbi:uncharacterized protein LOC117644713 [Thrips palmi]|uniref:Uncharacterized protein LOC117644713 n=1 Tax=Thrips palmi TaxID=161013 RepID=A0A6P8Z0X0_THRPL|nr:uncharacterized protein LOC117644713 [Thrips palmi]
MNPLPVWMLTLLLAWKVPRVRAECVFPEQWQGRWFQSGVPKLIAISSSDFETKGVCVHSEKDKYLIEDRKEKCFRCVSIHEMHPNVLQYKETYCETAERIQGLCQSIPIDTTLFSMFRADAAPQRCPLLDPPFNFTYSRNSGECAWPVSRLEGCTDPARLRLRYQACPDVPSTESTIEELECVADWKEGSTRYMVGKLQYHHKTAASDEERYRCFVYEPTPEGYSVAQSGDATCTGLTSATVGSKNMRLTRVRQRWPPCRLPEWLRAHHAWQSLNKHLQLQVGLHNVTLRRLRGHHRHHLHRHHQDADEAAEDQDNDLHVGPRPRAQTDQHAVNLHEESMTCHSVTERSDRVVQLVAHVTLGCDSGYSCLRLYQRDRHVMEMQRSAHTGSAEEACRADNFDPLSERFTTFITSDPQHRQCPYSGRYAVTNYLGGDIVCSTHPSSRANDIINNNKDIDNNDINSLVRPHPKDPKASARRATALGSKSLDVGCGTGHTMEFHSHCEADSITAYSCHGSWSDNGTSFTIAVPVSATLSGTVSGTLPGWGVGVESGPAGAEALRRDADPAVRRLCFVYRELIADDAGAVLNAGDGAAAQSALRQQPSIVIQSRVGEECHRHHLHGLHGLHGLQERAQAHTLEDAPPVEAEAVFWAFDLTPNVK